MWSKLKVLPSATALEFPGFCLFVCLSFGRISVCYSSVMLSFHWICLWKSHDIGFIFFTLFILLILFWHSTLKGIICLLVSGSEHAFKAFERTMYTRENTRIIKNIILASVWGLYQSHGPQDPKPSESNKSRKTHNEGVTLVSHLACLVI